MGAPLFHYTCEHGRLALGQQGQLEPLSMHSPDAVARMPERFLWMVNLVWLTDLPVPFPAEALGLMLNEYSTITCDRTRWRYRALDTSTCVPWLELLPTMPRSARMLAADAGEPRHWWVAQVPVPVVLA